MLKIENLLKASRNALQLLRSVHQKDMEETGDYSMPPYPEIVELENALADWDGR